MSRRQTAPIPNFRVCEQTGRYVARRPLSDNQIIRAARSLLRKSVAKGAAVRSADDVANYLQMHMGALPSEVFAVLFLDNKHRVIAFQEVFQGTINGAVVYPREVVRRCVELNAAAVIFAHNHPSGCVKPSFADRSITTRLQSALEFIDVRVLDHLVIAGDQTRSCRWPGTQRPPAQEAAQ